MRDEEGISKEQKSLERRNRQKNMRFTITNTEGNTEKEKLKMKKGRNIFFYEK